MTAMSDPEPTARSEGRSYANVVVVQRVLAICKPPTS